MRIALALLVLTACGASDKAEAPAKGGGGGGKGGGSAPQKRGPMSFPVEVQTVAAERVEYSVRAVGSLEAFEQVQVTARVAGVIERLDFAEGDQVKQGQGLVEIEPRRFQIAVEQARATMARVDAEKKEAEANLARRIEANAKSPGLVRAEEIENLRSQAAAGLGRAAEAKAQLDLAELNLRDAFVRAPMAGQIETRDVRTGQYVQPGAKVATLLRREPLLVKFPVSESESSKITKGHVLRFALREGAEPLRAVVSHVAQAADPATRMVPVIARVDDPRAKELRPGSFVQVEVPIDARLDAAVVPETAIRPSERGFIAFVVDGEVARERVLTLGLRTLDGRVEILSGLKAGDSLIIRGGEALTEGAKIKVVPTEAPKTGAPPRGPDDTPGSGATQEKKGAP